MTVTIEPSRAKGCVTAPPSKSAAHRALICGALSGGSKINNLAFSKDIEATARCLRALGAKINIDGDTAEVGCLDPLCPDVNDMLFCNESGSTLRFLLPLCMLSGKRITLSGSGRLLSRPLSVYEQICNEQKIEFIRTENGITVCGKLKSGHYRVTGDISSQFISGLMFALPLLPDDSEIEVTGAFESESYINMTVDMLKRFSVNISRKGNTYYIKGGQNYECRTLTVEGDCSNAAFLEGFNLLGGDVTVDGIDSETLQGDYVYRKMFKELKNGHRRFDLSDCPDLAPVMLALAAANGGAHFTGTRRLKIKESDRGEAMRKELEKLGCEVIIYDNEIEVKGCSMTAPSAPICGHNDHRVVMAMSLLLSITGGRIEGAEAVEKSFPDFFTKINSLTIGISYNDT